MRLMRRMIILILSLLPLLLWAQQAITPVEEENHNGTVLRQQLNAPVRIIRRYDVLSRKGMVFDMGQNLAGFSRNTPVALVATAYEYLWTKLVGYQERAGSIKSSHATISCSPMPTITLSMTSVASVSTVDRSSSLLMSSVTSPGAKEARRVSMERYVADGASITGYSIYG